MINNNLPPHLTALKASWSWAKLGDLIGKNGIFVDGDWVESKDQDPNGEVRLIQLADIGEIEFRNKSDRYLTYKKALELNCTFLEKGDLLIARMPDPLGRACIFPIKGKEKYVTVVDVAIVRVDEKKVNNDFLCYIINAPQSRDNISSLQSGSTRRRISRKNLGSINFPLPPLPEQKKIVEKIEELFSGLDSGVASLKKAKEQLRLYRQSVLAFAFSGRLVGEVGSRQPDLPSGRSAVGKMEMLKAAEPNVLYKSNDLPDGWKWVKLGEVCKQIIGGGTPSTKVEKYWNGNIDWITSADIYGLRDIRPRKKITKEAIKNSATNLVPKGTIIVVTRVSLGRLAIADNDICFSQDSQGLILKKEIVNTNYVLWFLSSATQIFKYKNRGTTIKGVTKKQLSDLEFVLPPLNQQTQIVEEIEKRFSEADNLEKAIDDSLEKSEALRQSILKQAFEGRFIR